MRKTLCTAFALAGLLVCPLQPAWSGGGAVPCDCEGAPGDCEGATLAPVVHAQGHCSACQAGGLLSRGVGGWHAHPHHAYEGADLYFNCGCNGSYKFPVPPLYTYHWPGMYSQQLMTDYHSPWRFPPLKPYEDEPDPVDESVRRLEAVLRPVSAQTPISPGGVSRGWKTMSERMSERDR